MLLFELLQLSSRMYNSDGRIRKHKEHMNLCDHAQTPLGFETLSVQHVFVVSCPYYFSACSNRQHTCHDVVGDSCGSDRVSEKTAPVYFRAVHCVTGHATNSQWNMFSWQFSVIHKCTSGNLILSDVKLFRCYLKRPICLKFTKCRHMHRWYNNRDSSFAHCPVCTLHCTSRAKPYVYMWSLLHS